MWGIGSAGGDFSLLPPPPPKSQLLGVTFEENPGRVLSSLAEKGLVMKEKKALDDNRLLQVFVFDGLPKEFKVLGGKTTVTFFKNELIALDFDFPPTYLNFLKVRGELFRSLGGRFSLEARQEKMDDHLKAHLAQLRKQEYGEDAEGRIRRSMLAGTTFFHYTLRDAQAEFRSTYTFLALSKSEGKKEPALLLHFGLGRGIDAAREYRQSLKRDEAMRLLP